MSDNIIGVLAPYFADDLDTALPLYQDLAGESDPVRFGFRDRDTGPRPVLPPAARPHRTCPRPGRPRPGTDLDPVINGVRDAGGRILEGPSPPRPDYG